MVKIIEWPKAIMCRKKTETAPAPAGTQSDAGIVASVNDPDIVKPTEK